MDIMWLFTVPVLKIAIKCGVGISAIFLVIQVIRWYFQAQTPNPFAKDDRKPRKEYITDQKKRDAIIKQSFHIDKVPKDLDAIVIGSGIGGLSTASIMAKAGKKVLVLEQHDQAGGCCHTFIDKGYEFDVGIHYIGKVGYQSINKTLIDQICDGQLEWEELKSEFDNIWIGKGDEKRKYPVVKGKEEWRKSLKSKFPKETKAIDKFFELVDKASSTRQSWVILKILPLWLSKFLINTGLIHLITCLWRGTFKKTTLEIIRELTDDKDLQTVLSYCWGDYGTPPSDSHFLIQAALNSHFYDGGFYPVGGASEIALNIIPVIERSGGKVLVRANVKEILHNGEKAMGVKIEKGSETYEVQAPIIISTAGVYNTFLKLLPQNVAQKSYYHKIAKNMKPASAAMSVFVGLNASNEELKLEKENVWAFPSNDSSTTFRDYLNLDAEEALNADVPLVFVSFPSAKDPKWSTHPGRENKSTCALVTLSNWEWFQKWANAPLKKRGDDYDEIKKTIGEKCIERACELYPQIRNHIDYVEIGSPATNNYYLAQPHGEIYGLDHSMERFQPMMLAKLRPETDIPGLYLSGQDVFVAGFMGAIFGGLLAAGAVLERNTLIDLAKLHKSNRKSKKKSE